VYGNRLKEMFRSFFISAILFFPLFFYGQGSPEKNKVRTIFVRNAESLSYDQEKNNAKVLRGNVICEHEGALLHCDTALIYEDQNRMIATGHILITKGDSIRVTGDKLFYDGRTKLATLENNVKCVEKDMTLTTNLLTFDVGRSIANYYNGGTIVNKENTLTSKNGHYYSGSKEAAFHYDVVLTNPDYKMNSDTLRYRIPNKTSYFLGPSIITSKSDYIYCENGWYDTDKEKAQFSRNAILVTAQQKLKGDSLVYDRVTKTGKAYRNVSLVDTAHKSVIYGDFIQYKETYSEALVTKKALYARVIESDTLFIAADTLYHRDLDSVDKFLNAYHNVRIYKKDIQAICDSASMVTKDSLLHLHYTPVLWSNSMQATSKFITVDIGKNSVKGFKLDGKAFLIQQVDSLSGRDKFNQLSGRTITGQIRRDTIRKVTVTGNAEMLYFPKNKDKIIGMNKTACTQIFMWFNNGEIDRVSLQPLTTGNIEPIDRVEISNARLKGFNWQSDKRPTRSRLHNPGTIREKN
jgi:lipopolysaccharide export system protein LptA